MFCLCVLCHFIVSNKLWKGYCYLDVLGEDPESMQSDVSNVPVIIR